MTWFRTIRGLARPLAVAFLLAQLAGVVPSPRVDAQLAASSPGSHGHHHDRYDHGDGKVRHHDGDRGTVDHCCALHAFFAAVLPPAIVTDTVAVLGKPLTADADHRGVGVPPGRLDRPPRPLALI
jgi:hypothetical protein